MTKILVDEDMCIGCGACVSACPECFELNENGKSVAIAHECGCDLGEVAINCPVQAIVVTEEA